MAGKGSVRILFLIAVGQDHTVKLQTLGVGKGDQKNTLLRQTVAGADDRKIFAEQGRGLFHTARTGADDGRKAFLLLCVFDSPEQFFGILISVGAGTENRFVAGRLHGGYKDFLLFGQEACKQIRDLG